MTGARAWHNQCFACGTDNSHGLALDCRRQEDGSVRGTFTAQAWMQGYAGRLQGGIITTLLDSAMCQCLYHHGTEAVTGSLSVHFDHPAPVDGKYCVLARIRQQRHGAWLMDSELRLAAQPVARASGVFFPRPDQMSATPALLPFCTRTPHV